MKHSLIFLFVFLLTPLSIFADNRVGNGGDVVICKVADGTAYYVLDQFELSGQDIAVIKLGDGRLSLDDKLQLLFDRLAQTSVTRAKFYSELYNNYIRTKLEIIDRPFTDIQDHGVFIRFGHVQSNCHIEQAARFFVNKNRYQVNKSIWYHLSNDQKAILVFHELIYTEAVLMGNTNSLSTRRINSVYFGNITRSFEKVFLFLAHPFVSLSTSYKEYEKALLNTISEKVASFLISNNYSEMSEHSFCLVPEYEQLLKKISTKFPYSSEVHDAIQMKSLNCGFMQ